MKRVLAILVLLVTLMGWLRANNGAGERECCCGAACACQATTGEKTGGCPCGKEKNKLEQMPLCVVEWPQAAPAPEVRTPVPAVVCRVLTPAELALIGETPPHWHAPPKAPPHPRSLSYAGFCSPLRA